jgi:tyrosine-protein phosphatase YwqE
LNCDITVIEKLGKISAEEILKTYAVNNPNGFIINVTVKDNSILDQLQKGIVYGLNNSPYVKEKIETKKARDRELIKRTTDEIAKLNVTKQIIDSLIQTSQRNSSSFMLDISRISAQTIELNEKLFNYQEDLKFLAGIQVLENFNKGKLSRNGLLKLSLLGMASGLFIGYLVSLFLFIRIKLKTSRLLQ